MQLTQFLQRNSDKSLLEVQRKSQISTKFHLRYWKKESKSKTNKVEEMLKDSIKMIKIENTHKKTENQGKQMLIKCSLAEEILKTDTPSAGPTKWRRKETRKSSVQKGFSDQ